jgi:Yip1 domain
VLPTDPIRPLKDVWLRPRRVFRELAARPVGITDYLLAAAQGIANSLALYRSQETGTHNSAADILVNSLAFGAVAGVASLFLMALLYRRLGIRAGGQSTTQQVIHVLAYGGVPTAASLVIWVLTALLAGDAIFVEKPPADLEGFLTLLLHGQFICYMLMSIWSIVLQVMGFSEIQGLTVRKAFGVWVLGQFIALLACFVVAFIVETLFPGVLVQSTPHP